MRKNRKDEEVIGQLKQEAAKRPLSHQVKQLTILFENSAVCVRY